VSSTLNTRASAEYLASICKSFILAAFSFALPTFAIAQSAPLERLRTCLAIEDMTKERLDCFDAIMQPDPKPIAAKPATIAECSFLKEEDERLRCYNGFLVARAPSPPRPEPQRTSPQIPAERFRPCNAINGMTKERLECFDKIVPVAPRGAFTAKPRSIFECRFFREEDDRLRCYLNFAARLLTIVQQPPPSPPPTAQLPVATPKHARVGRGGCGSRGGAGYRTRSGKCASRRR
jgi:hypothetical protein